MLINRIAFRKLNESIEFQYHFVRAIYPFAMKFNQFK